MVTTHSSVHNCEGGVGGGRGGRGGGGGGMGRGPQSLQSVPRAQMSNENSLPGPPSSQTPLGERYEQSSEQPEFGGGSGDGGGGGRMDESKMYSKAAAEQRSRGAGLPNKDPHN